MKLRNALSMAIFLPWLSPNVQADIVIDYATGRKGEHLKSTLRAHCGPDNLCPTLEDAFNNIIDIISSGHGLSVDIMTGTAINDAPDEAGLHRLIPSEWYAVNPDLQSRAELDLFNLTLSSNEVISLRSTYPIYDVSTPKVSGDKWSFGNTLYYGDDRFICFEPADEYKGAIARAIFYMVTIYPATLWTEWGETMFLNNQYPTLSDYSLECYLQWHRQHPVNDEERDRNRRIEVVQGNRNPFIDHPILAEHLWGNKKDEPFATSTDNPSDDNNTPPLQSSYTIDGPDIQLRSPYIPDEASWRANGNVVTTKTVSPKALGIGKHELSYSSRNEHGKLIITITP